MPGAGSAGPGRRARAATAAVALLVLLVAPQVLARSNVFRLSTLLVLVLFASAYWLVVAASGRLSLGHAAFFGLGAYSSALVLQAGLGLPLALLAGAAVGMLAALVMGLVCARASGIYFAMLTLAIAQLAYLMVFRLDVFGGQDGLPGIRAPMLLIAGRWILDLGSQRTLYYVVLAVTALSFVAVMTVDRSSFGQVLRSAREDPERTAALGGDVGRHHLLALVVSGLLTGLAGALVAPLDGIVTPDLLLWTESALPLIVILLGGLRSVWGAVLGAVAFEALRYLTRSSTNAQLYTGVVLLVVVLVLPTGLLGLREQLRRRRRGDGRAAPARDDGETETAPVGTGAADEPEVLRP